jgi:hypothetical protein
LDIYTIKISPYEKLFYKISNTSFNRISFGLNVLQKSDSTPEEPLAIQLLKINSYNPSTGVEGTGGTEFTYENGKIKTVSTARVILNVTYNASGKVTLVSGTNNTTGAVSYNLEYNSAGQIEKVKYIYMNPTDFGYTKTFTYNTAGKVSKTNYLSAVTGSIPFVVDYTWNGDNIASTISTSGTNVYTTTYVSYDNKLNPYNLGDGLAAIIAGSPQSKNNVTEIKTVTNATTVVQKRSYTYNAADYAITLALLDGSNEGTKFTYNK